MRQWLPHLLKAATCHSVGFSCEVCGAGMLAFVYGARFSAPGCKIQHAHAGMFSTCLFFSTWPQLMPETPQDQNTPNRTAPALQNIHIHILDETPTWRLPADGQIRCSCLCYDMPEICFRDSVIFDISRRIWRPLRHARRSTTCPRLGSGGRRPTSGNPK